MLVNLPLIVRSGITCRLFFQRVSCLFFNTSKTHSVTLCSIPQVTVVEMDGVFDRLDELIYVESHLSNLSTKFYGEVTQQMLKHQEFPGSNNGTGFFQTIIGLKIRDLFEQIVASRSATPAAAAKA